MRKRKSTFKFEKCVKKTRKYCRKKHYPGESVEECANNICGSIKAKQNK